MVQIFVLDGVVIGKGTAAQSDVKVSCPAPGAVVYRVTDDTPVEIGWSCTVVDDVPTFSDSPK